MVGRAADGVVTRSAKRSVADASGSRATWLVVLRLLRSGTRCVRGSVWAPPRLLRSGTRCVRGSVWAPPRLLRSGTRCVRGSESFTRCVRGSVWAPPAYSARGLAACAARCGRPPLTPLGDSLRARLGVGAPPLTPLGDSLRARLGVGAPPLTPLGDSLRARLGKLYSLRARLGVGAPPLTPLGDSLRARLGVGAPPAYSARGLAACAARKGRVSAGRIASAATRRFSFDRRRSRAAIRPGTGRRVGF